MSDFQVRRSYRGNILVAPPGANPVTGEWKRAKNSKNYFYTTRSDVEQYGRASKAGEHLKGGGGGLADFKAAFAVIGAVTSDSVRSRISTLINQYNGDPYYAGDDGGSESGKDRLLAAVETACEVAGANRAREEGTEFHALWDMMNRGEKPKLVQPHLLERLEVYRTSVKPIKFIDGEIVIVNDELKKAGSFDHLMEIPKGAIGPDGTPLSEPWIVVGDGKTGKWDAKYPAGVYAQLASYGLGQRYDQDNNIRTPIHPDLNTDWGVLVHYPLSEERPEVGFYWVDLSIGKRAAELNNSLDRMIKHFGSKEGKPIKFSLEAS